MSVLTLLSHHVFHPLLDLKEGSRRLSILRELERTQWLDQAALEAIQRERLPSLRSSSG